MWFGKPPQHNGNQVSNFLIKELALNEQQQANYMQMKETHEASITPLRKKGGGLRTRFFAHLGKENADSIFIKAVLDSIGENQKEIEMLTFQHFTEVRALCDAQQKLKFDKVIKEALKMMRPAPPRPKP